MSQQEQLKRLANRILNEWAPILDDPDQEASGSDAVDALSEYVALAKEATMSTDPSPGAPSYKELVAVLGTAVAEWAYLFPEKFDDDQHEAQSRKNLKQAERIYKQALKAITKGAKPWKPPFTTSPSRLRLRRPRRPITNSASC